MRHVIVVVGSKEQDVDEMPGIKIRGQESRHEVTWYARMSQEGASELLDDRRSRVVSVLLAPVLAYKFYVFVHSTKLWSGRRPLIFVRGRSLASRIAAYAGTWGGGDVVMPAEAKNDVLKPTRFLLDSDGTMRNLFE